MQHLIALAVPIVVLLLVASYASSAPATQPSAKATSMKDTVLEMLDTGDAMAAVEYVIRHEGDAEKAIHLFGELQRELYWKKKNLAASVAMGRAGLQHGLS